jgi:MarR family 2-MHQ and catechol resistance regulon transcriptional repressor
MGTKYAGTAAEVRALNAFINLVRAAESIAARTTGMFRRYGLTESQFGVMEMLHHLGPMCQADLGRKLLKTSGNMTTVIDNLEKRDLVRRERSHEDRRYITVHLTPEGQRLVEEVFPQHMEAIVDEMQSLSAAEQEQLRTLCRRVGVGPNGNGKA